MTRLLPLALLAAVLLLAPAALSQPAVVWQKKSPRLGGLLLTLARPASFSAVLCTRLRLSFGFDRAEGGGSLSGLYLLITNAKFHLRRPSHLRFVQFEPSLTALGYNLPTVLIAGQGVVSLLRIIHIALPSFRAAPFDQGIQIRSETARLVFVA